MSQPKKAAVSSMLIIIALLLSFLFGCQADGTSASNDALSTLQSIANDITDETAPVYHAQYADCEIDATELKNFLEQVEWIEDDSAPSADLLPTITVYPTKSKDCTLILFSTEPNLAEVQYNGTTKYYQMAENDYTKIQDMIIDTTATSTLDPLTINLYHHGIMGKYTKEANNKFISTIANLVEECLPEKYELTNHTLNNEIVQNEFFRMQTCVELIMEQPQSISLKDETGEEFTIENYDKLMLCLESDNCILAYSLDGQYQATALGALNEDKTSELYELVRNTMERSIIRSDTVIVAGNELPFPTDQMAQVQQTLSEQQIQKAIYKSAMFYNLAQTSRFSLVSKLSTDYLNEEMEKWGNNEPSEAEIIMQLSNYTDINFPIAISALSVNDGNLQIQYKLSDIEYADIELEFDSNGEPFVNSFSYILAD